MFIGHFGVALAAKRAAPRASLGALFFATQFADLLWPILLIRDIEHVRIAPGITAVTPFDFYDYPISHSLVTLFGWALLVGLGYFAITRYARGAWLMGAGVLSHWFLDVLMHRPDLPLWPSGPKAGLGLWNSWTASIVLEILVFSLGLWIYVRFTSPQDAIGRYAFWSLMALLFFGWISSLIAGAPPSERAIAWGALFMWIAVPWGWWADKHRSASLKSGN